MKKKPKVSNHDIIPLALYELGGIGKFIDVEDIFMKCYEISPERFGWRKHELPNYKTIYKALVDFEDRYPNYLIKTQDGLSRQLSSEGFEWIRSKAPIFRKLFQSPEKIPPSRRSNQKQLNNIYHSKLFQKYIEDRQVELRKFEVADLFLCSPDSPKHLWKERIETFRSVATQSKRYDIVSFLDYVENEHLEWFRG